MDDLVICLLRQPLAGTPDSEASAGPQAATVIASSEQASVDQGLRAALIKLL